MKIANLNLIVSLSLCLFSMGCAHSPNKPEPGQSNPVSMKPVTMAAPVELVLKGDPKTIERVEYLHQARSRAYENGQIREQGQESVDFISTAETLKVDPPDKNGNVLFTQTLSIEKKDGTMDLHEFAMPDLGEKLDVIADGHGRIYHSGEYPENSIFYVPPVSLPDGKVSVGDTWPMEAQWISLGEMVPYHLSMVSILKGFWACGRDTCAEIEVSGDVTLEGPMSRALQFKSQWKGTLYFAIGAGTVAWSRTDSIERLISETVRRDSVSCLESVLLGPAEAHIEGLNKPSCEPKAFETNP